ncbi:GIY-YIG nuclease family protein [Candidatus Falkowbacteria bacterium]|nr:GIY-YIG nuclease family protein [Candidatus Falkowbacteria bacterium]
MFYVYVLKSIKDSQLYIGSTKDLQKRFTEHNNGLVGSTRMRRPFKLIYYESYAAERDARLRESRLKLRSRAFAQLKSRIMYSLKT